MYCETCDKEVVVMGIPVNAVSDRELERMRKKIESEGRIILFNPPPVGPYRCPVCHTELKEKNSEM
jgi:hypothetical protein